MTDAIWPGVRDRFAGDAETPAGSPPIVTATVLDKPLSGVASKFTEAFPPGFNVIWPGSTARPKLGAGLTEIAADVLWFSEPCVAVKPSAAGPSVAMLVAEKLIATLDPNATVSGDAGEAETPAGSPVMVTLTLPDSP